MKRLIIAILVTLASILSAQAQSYDGQESYSDLKGRYSYKYYVPAANDPYNPVLFGSISAIIPGSGQYLMGETMRGTYFFVAGIMMFSAADLMAALRDQLSDSSRPEYNLEKAKKYNRACLGFLVAYAGVAAWSWIDASRVAKVKNMYYQEILGRRMPVNMSLAPSMSLTPDQKLATGVSFTLAF